MGDILVSLMGILDVIAGILIVFAFDFKPFFIMFGILMILKGIMSFDFFN